MIKDKKIAPFSIFQWLFPISLVVGIRLFSCFPESVEVYYSSIIYPKISLVQRVLFGWIPFSFGDIGYCALYVYLLIFIIRLLISIKKRKFSWINFKSKLLKFLRALLWLYIIFSILWGLNYIRLGIASQLELKNTKYSDDDLKALICDVVDELNTTRVALGDSNYVYPTEKEIIDTSFYAYENIKCQFPFLGYEHLSVKPSLLTAVVSYAGYSGYYNPFSGEAQVNTDLPKFYMPFVTCHEMAHQLGYASESEASFVSYLVGIHSKNTLFRYSVLFELFFTANSELMQRDFWGAILNLKSLNPLVKRDRKIFRDFILGKENKVEPIIKNVYDQYLKANQQKSGVNSYNELVGWVIDYRKKYGKK